MDLQIFVSEDCRNRREKKKLCFLEAKIINILYTCRDIKAFLMDFLVIYYNTLKQYFMISEVKNEYCLM